MAHSEATTKSTVPQTVTLAYSVELWPRNTDQNVGKFYIEVQATSKQEAINKAITQYPGHAWGAVNEFTDEEDPTLPVFRQTVSAADWEKCHGHCASMAGHLLDCMPESAPPVPTTAAETAVKRHALWCERAHFGPCRRGRATGTEKQAHEGSKITDVDDSKPYVNEVDDSNAKQPGLWAEAWKPTVMEGEELDLQTIVAQAIGTASMCWENVNRAGIFDSEKASWITGGAINEIEKLVFWQIEKERESWRHPHTYPHQSGDHTVIGPECFADKDDYRIMWKGQCYMLWQPEQERISDQKITLGNETLVELQAQAEKRISEFVQLFEGSRGELHESITRAYNAGYQASQEDADERFEGECAESEPEDPTLSAGVKYESACAEEPEEARQWRIQRQADQASVIELIMHYKNPASDAEKLRQIRVVME